MSSPYVDDYDYEEDVPQPKSKKGHKRKCSKDVKDKSYKTSAWTAEEDAILKESLMEGLDIKEVADQLNRSQSQCLHRWQKVLDPKLVKGSWTREEDELLKNLVQQYGAKNWSVIASHLKGRIGKQCRERWYNHLDPEIRKDPWTPEEDRIIYEFHAKYGNKWSEMAKILVGRPSNAIKNHWNSTLKRRLMYVNGEEVAASDDGAAPTRRARKGRTSRKRKAVEDLLEDEESEEEQDYPPSPQESAEDMQPVIVEDNDYVIKNEMSDAPVAMTFPNGMAKWEHPEMGFRFQVTERLGMAPVSQGFNEEQQNLYGELFSELNAMNSSSSGHFDTDELFTPWDDATNDASLTRNVIDLNNSKQMAQPQSFVTPQYSMGYSQPMSMYDMPHGQQMSHGQQMQFAPNFMQYSNEMMGYGQVNFQPMPNQINPFSPYAPAMVAAMNQSKQQPMQMNYLEFSY